MRPAVLPGGAGQPGRAVPENRLPACDSWVCRGLVIWSGASSWFLSISFLISETGIKIFCHRVVTRFKKDCTSKGLGTKDMFDIFLYNCVSTTYQVDGEDDSRRGIISKYWQPGNFCHNSCLSLSRCIQPTLLTFLQQLICSEKADLSASFSRCR